MINLFNRRARHHNLNALRIALVSDELTFACLKQECHLVSITPLNYRSVLCYWKPDILLVESAWKGKRESWKYKIAAYPDHPKRNNSVLANVVSHAKNLGIPTVFWNKEDSVHFDRFIDSAVLFDYIFTVDENAVPRYRERVDAAVPVNTLMFSAQSKIHNFTGFDFKYNRANFVGSYSHHIHDKRRTYQDVLFSAASSTELGLTVFDRNSSRKSANYRYPAIPGIEVMPSVPYEQTAQIYKDYLVSLNVNTVVNSATMFSRRLVEIIACGGIAVTTPAVSVDCVFSDYCYVVSNEDETKELFHRLKHGPTSDDFERARAGSEYVLQHHTWSHRLEEIARVVEV